MIFTESVMLHPMLFLPVTKYLVVTFGVAIGLAILELDSPVTGNQL